MSISTDDPIFSAPCLDFLNPSFPWKELDENDARVVVVVVVAWAIPTRNKAVVRGEIVASPAYIRACNGRSTMIDRAALGPAIVQWALDGHDVQVERREVQCSLLDIIAMHDDASGDDATVDGE